MKICASVSISVQRGVLFIALLAAFCGASPFAVVLNIQGESWRNLDYQSALQSTPLVGDILQSPARLSTVNPSDQLDMALANSRVTMRLRGATLEHMGRVLRLQSGALELHTAEQGVLPILEAGTWALRPAAGSRLLLEIGGDGVVRWQCLAGSIQITDQRSGRTTQLSPSGKMESSL